MHMSEPVFVHSLFRAGSTYIFHVFRRSPHGYRCYHEPLHETALFARDNPQLLLRESEKKMNLLRHPGLHAPYFQELYQVADVCLDELHKSAVYDAYFSSSGPAAGSDFWKCLIQAGFSRPVIHECRTSSRIGTIKSALGGVHVYLWRNPWDQWWSSQVDDYFQVAYQLFVNAPEHPGVITQLRREIGFKPCQSQDLQKQMEHFYHRLLSPRDSYLLFHVLWCLGWFEAQEHADILINMDQLSRSPDYRNKIIETLAAHGITDLDFSDCRLPRTFYRQQEKDFFLAQEARARNIFLNSGWSGEDLGRIDLQSSGFADGSDLAGVPREDLLDQAARARDLYLRSLDGRSRDQAQVRKAQKEKKEANKALEKQKSRLKTLQDQLKKAEKRADGAGHKITRLEREMDNVYASTSWRMTRPLRWMLDSIRELLSLKPGAKQQVLEHPETAALSAGATGEEQSSDRYKGQRKKNPGAELSGQTSRELTATSGRIYRLLKNEVQRNKNGEN